MLMTAKNLLHLLEIRHSKDIFETEIQIPNSLGRFDALAVKRSWTQACCYGYEVKVHRSDFIRDDKWPAYLPFCNQFYFVCPHGVISKTELGEEAGLIYSSRTGNRLYTVKKAPHRTVDLQEMFRAILITRHGTAPQTKRECNLKFWRWWLHQKKERQVIGHEVSGRLREIYVETRRENYDLKCENIALLEVKELLKEFGLDTVEGVQDKMRHRLAGPDASYLISALRSNYFRSRRTLLDIGENLEEK